MRFFLVLLFLPVFLQAQEFSTLNIKVDGIEQLKGKLMFKVLNSQGKEIYKSTQPVKSNPEIVKLKLKLGGSYAIAMFHDANNNNELDKNFTGIPKEVYAFSNNARGTFGPPDLKDQLFRFDKDTQEIKMSLK